MKIVRKPSTPYGDRDFDTGYLTWGFHDDELRRKDALSALQLFSPRKKVLDVACGDGKYHDVWIGAGCSVSGVDISEVFIERCGMNNPSGAYTVCDLSDYDVKEAFEAVVWLDYATVTGKIIRNLYGSLKDGGVLLFDVRNPNHPRMRMLARQQGRSWSEENGAYKLARDEYIDARQITVHETVTIDTHTDTITIWSIENTDLGVRGLCQMMAAAGFSDIELRRRDGGAFDVEDQEEYRFWIVAYKR